MHFLDSKASTFVGFEYKNEKDEAWFSPLVHKICLVKSFKIL